MVVYRLENKLRTKRAKLASLVILLVLVVAGSGAYYWQFMRTAPETLPVPVIAATEEEKQPVVEEENLVQLPDLQAVIAAWDKKTGGTASVVIQDPKTGETLASLNPDATYFAASIYKLYVAYVGYQKIDAGAYDADELYLNGWTRGRCLDEMIRSSHSPCGEKLLAELGGERLTAQLKTWGLENTSMTNITTSAADAVVILTRLERGEGLSDVSREAFLDSMKDQDDLYRRGLPRGFEGATVYNKVGWNEQLEWHDTAVVRIDDETTLTIAVLTRSVGSRNVAALAADIEAAFLARAAT